MKTTQNPTNHSLLQSDEFKIRNEKYLRAISSRYQNTLSWVKEKDENRENRIEGNEVIVNISEDAFGNETLVEKMMKVRGDIAHLAFHSRFTDFSVLKEIEKKYEKTTYDYQIEEEYLNIVEDYAVDMAGKFVFPGIAKFVDYTNHKCYEQLPDLQMVEMMLGSLAAHRIACMQFMLKGRLKGEFLKEETKELFEKTKPLLNEAKLTRTTFQRYEVSQKITELVDSLKEEAKELNQMSRMENPKGNDVNEKAFGQGKATPKEAIEKMMQEMGQSGEVQDAQDSNAVMQEGKTEQGQGQQMSMEMSEQMMDSMTKEMMQEMAEMMKATKGKDPVKENEEGKMEESEDEKLIKEIKEHLQNVDYGNIHHGMNIDSKFNLRDKPNQYKSIKKKMHPVIRSTTKRLRDLLRFNEDEKRTGQVGGFLTQSQLWRKDGKVFSEKRDKNDEAELGILLLVDESGSMENYARDRHAREASIVMAEVCQSLNIPFGVIGHTADSDDEIMIARHYVMFEKPIEKQKLRLPNIDSRSYNRDGMAIHYATEYIKRQSFKDKLLIVISDGIPNHYFNDYEDHVGEEDVKKKVKELEKNGVSIVGLAIGDGQEQIHGMYKNAITINKLEKLPITLTKLIEKKILKK